jgi:SNF2 family DNA or RNA helicase
MPILHLNPLNPVVPVKPQVPVFIGSKIDIPGIQRVDPTSGWKQARAAATNLRPMSNLIGLNPHELSKQELRDGFLFFYYNYMRKPLKLGPQLLVYAQLVCSILDPTFQPKPLKGKTLKEVKGFATKYTEAIVSLGLSRLVSVRKDAASKVCYVKVPVAYAAGNTGFANLASILGKPKAEGSAFPVATGVFSTKDLKANEVFSPLVVANLHKANATLEVTSTGASYIAYLNFQLPEKIACYLTSSAKWELLHPRDLYTAAREWVTGYFTVPPPQYTVPISHIANDLKTKSIKGEPRLNNDSILVEESGEYWLIPENLDATMQYEDLLSRHLANPDGSYCAMGEENGQMHFKAATMPQPMPVYVDWVNMRFAYTSKEARLIVKDLDRSQPANASHYAKLFKLPVFGDKTDMMPSVLSRIHSALTSTGLLPSSQSFIDFFRPEAEQLVLNREETGIEMIEEITLEDLYKFSNYFPDEPNGKAQYGIERARAWLAAIPKLDKFIEQNTESFYRQYSVETVCQMRAVVRIMATNGHKLVELFAADHAARKVYIEQKIDPNYKVPAVPYVQPNLGFLPHQERSANMLRESPKFAILGIAAGGGKTVTAIFDALKELKQGTSKRILIMCPSHLVSQYVKEVVYVSEGRVNAIPVTTYGIRRLGLKRLQEMIEAAPINTIVVADYNVIRLKPKTVAYGSSSTTVFPIIEFLRQFRFDYMLADEAHYLKNASKRQSSAHRLIADIDKKRLATGTLVKDTLKDLPKQLALMDPTVLGGSIKAFTKKWALEVKGDKVIQWKPGAEAAIKALIKSNTVFVQQKRKEWIALLPPSEEEFHVTNADGTLIELSPKQREVYDMILAQAQEELMEKLASDKKLKKLFDKLANKANSNNDDEEEEGNDDDENGDDAADEEEDLDISTLVKPYLARLEQFMSAPGEDKLGREMLSGADLLSPKVRRIIEIAKKHLDDKIPGKILIFTKYKIEAEAIYNSMPPDMKAMTIHYLASQKEEARAKFEENPKYQIMVGVEDSMNTGLNLQYASRLIRANTPWTPGDFEQGNARIGRPNIKTEEQRDKIYYDWVVVNNCVVGETLVPTEYGIKRIDALGDLDGKQSQKLNIRVGSIRSPQETLRWWNNGIAHTRTITTSTNRRIQGTPNHGLLVLRDGAHVWVHLEDIKKGDLLCVNLQKITRKSKLALNLQMPEYKGQHDIERRGLAYTHLATSPVFSTKTLEEATGYSNWQCITLVKRLEHAGYIECLEEKRGRIEGQYKKTQAFSQECLVPTPEQGVKKVPKYMTPELAYALGVFVAEGCCHNKRILNVGMQNKEPVQAFAEYIYETFGIEKDVVARELDPERSKVVGQVVYEDTMYTVSLYSPTLVNVFEQLGVYMDGRADDGIRRGSHSKVIPWSILEADEESQLAFLAGFWEGDGSQSNGELKFCSSSEDIRSQLQVLFNAHGFRASKGNRYSLTVPALDAEELWNQIAPYIKGPKTFRDGFYSEARSTYGIPANYWIDLVQSRFLRRDKPLRDKSTYTFLNDDGYEVSFKGREHLFIGTNYYTSTKMFRYNMLGEGLYDNFLDLLKHVSKQAHALLVDALERRYSYEPVISNRKSGLQPVYDLSVSDGTDGKEPSYVVNGVVGHNSIDITKVAYLITKIISRAKFDEDGLDYQALETPDVLKMSLETIFANNSTDTLAEYFGVYREYQMLIRRDYKQYKDEHKDELDAKGRVKLTPIPRAKNLDNSKLMLRTPYVPGTEIYGANQLGLVRFDVAVNMTPEEVEALEADTGEDDSEDDSNPSWKAMAAAQYAKVAGKWAHTDMGDGEILKVTKGGVVVRLPNGQKYNAHKLAVFVITRGTTNSRDMKRELAKFHGDIPLDAPPEVPVVDEHDKKLIDKKGNKKGVPPPVEEEEETLDDSPHVELDFTICNDFLGISLLTLDDHEVLKRMQVLGFQTVPQYWFTRVIGDKTFLRLVKAWAEKGFSIPKENSASLKAAYDHLRQYGLAKHTDYYGVAYKNNFRNFLLQQGKPHQSSDVIYPYPLIQDGVLYVCLPLKGHPGSAKAAQVGQKVPKTRWQKSDPNEMFWFAGDKPQLKNKLKEIIDSGIEIDNIDELKEKYKALRPVKKKGDFTE